MVPSYDKKDNKSLKIVLAALQRMLDECLDRSDTASQIVHILESFDEQCNNVQFKRGIYLYGSSGCGKTFFMMDILRRMNYDVIKYDAGDNRNKHLIDGIASNNMSNNNVLNMMYRRKQKIAILMDEIESMNSGDKWGITSLIKLIRQKKTKRQKSEKQTFNPIICLSNYNVDKKIKELMKVCHVFELKTPTWSQVTRFLGSFPLPMNTMHQIADLSQGDLRKLFFYLEWSQQNDFPEEDLEVFQKKSFNEDAKRMTQRILETPILLSEHNNYINETDRTIVALLWHENIVDHLQYNLTENGKKKGGRMDVFGFYDTLLENICFADYIDRITFQNQIWQFNEMSSLIKTMYNNKLFHETGYGCHPKVSECRFTKILTKYSTEYNNAKFVSGLCNKLDMDRKDVISLFQELRLRKTWDTVNTEGLEITKLDIKRFYRYLDQNEEKAKQGGILHQEEEEDEEDEDEEEDCLAL